MSKIKTNKSLSLPVHRRLVVLLVICCLLGLFVAGSVVNYFSIKRTIISTYPTNLQQQQLTQLDIYEQGYSSAVANYFSNALNTITNLASSSSTMQDISSGQTNSLSTTFEHQREFDQQFNTIAAYSASGQVLALSTDAAIVKPNGGTLDKANPVMRAAVLRHAPTITSAYFGNANRYIIAFTAPVTNVQNVYIGSIVGTTTLSDLADRVNFLSSYKEFSNVITDVNGNTLVENNQAVTKTKNIAKSDMVVGALQKYHNTQTASETNYAGQPVVAEGKVVSFDHSGSVYVVSYIQQPSLSAVVRNTQDNLGAMTLGFVALSITFVCVAICLLLGMWYHRRKRRSLL